MAVFILINGYFQCDIQSEKLKMASKKKFEMVSICSKKVKSHTLVLFGYIDI